jgi:hypothetical protein
MIREAIDRILDLQRPPTFKDCEGVERSTNNKGVISPTEIPPTEGSTLDGAIAAAEDHHYIQCSMNKVIVFGFEHYNNRMFRRDVHIAKPILPDNFRFGHAMDIESFIINTSDFFIRDDPYKQMIAAISCITDVQEQVIDDDGISQTVSYKARVGRKGEGKLEPFVTLRAYRTFREVEQQPEATYLIRIGKGRDGPTITLHEASGYDWKIKCTNAVYQYIRGHVGDDVTVIR